MDRPSWDEIFLIIAETIKLRSSCIRRRVGAVLVAPNVNKLLSDLPFSSSFDIISTGYNGTPIGTPNCNEGGCARCASDVPSGEGYDRENCIHAEQNAIIMAARKGISTVGSTMYITAEPCLLCLKEIIQAGIKKIVYSSTSTMNLLGMPIKSPPLTSDQIKMVSSSGVEIYWFEGGKLFRNPKYVG